MKVIDLKGNGQLRDKGAELDVPHLGDILTFSLPLIGPGSHAEVMHEIDKQGLLRPTTAQIISLLDLALQNQDESHCAEFIQKFKKASYNQGYLWSATETSTLLGRYLVYDNIDGKMPSEGKTLDRMCQEGDQKVRRVKLDFEYGSFSLNHGYLSLDNFFKHPVVLAHVGRKMIPTVEKVVRKLNSDKPKDSALGGYIYAVGQADGDSSTLDNNKFTAVYPASVGGRLGIGCENRTYDKMGYALGILPRK